MEVSYLVSEQGDSSEITDLEQIEEMIVLLNDAGIELEDNEETERLLHLYLKKAKYIYLSLVYPFEREVDELPDNRAKDWQTRCAIELYLLKDKGNLSRYSENGLSEGYGKAGLSQDLLSDLPPARGKVIY